MSTNNSIAAVARKYANAISEKYNGSTLAWWLSTDNKSAIKEYLDSGLDSSISYHLEAVNLNEEVVIVERSLPDGEITTSFRLVWCDDSVWHLNLHLWYGYTESL
mgnify:CR=1 FL=1